VLDSPKSATLAVTIIPVGLTGGAAAPGCGRVRATDVRRAVVRALVRALGRCRVHVHVRVYVACMMDPSGRWRGRGVG
jgi:hypothetical protein